MSYQLQNRPPLPINEPKVKGLVVIQSNHLIEASYRMDVVAKRLMLCLLAKIDTRKPIPKKIHLDVNEYVNITRADQKIAYRDMKRGAEQLLGTIIKTYDHEARVGEMCVLADYLRYFDEEGRIECTFSRWIEPYIHYLAKNFTRLQLTKVMKFRSFYTIRIYELLMQFQTTRERYISLDKLREILQLGEKQYPRFADLRRRVIDVAIREINEKSEYEVNWNKVRTGRRITGLMFVFEERKQQRLF